MESLQEQIPPEAVKEIKSGRKSRIKTTTSQPAPPSRSRVIFTPLSADIEEATPIDLALGLNFIGDLAYKALGFEIGEIPPIPSSLNAELLNSPCPFHTNRKIAETHILCLIPANLNNQELSIISLIKTLAPNFNFGTAASIDDCFYYKAEFEFLFASKLLGHFSSNHPEV